MTVFLKPKADNGNIHAKTGLTHLVIWWCQQPSVNKDK